MKSKDHPDVKLFRTRAAWETWLGRNHETSRGLWLKIARKTVAAGVSSVSYDEALEVALCHGWIDGTKKSHDAGYWLQRFTPRGTRSVWSTTNRAKAIELVEGGRMKPAGMAAVEAARRSGRWETAYDSPRVAEVPADLERAVKASPKARVFFETLDRRNRYAMIHRLQTARKPETRRKRIELYVGMLERGELLYPRR